MTDESGRDKGSQGSMGKQSADRGDSEVGRFEGDDQHGSSPDVGSASETAKQAGDKAFEGNETQAGSKSEGGAIYAPSKGVEDVGESISKRGEDRADHTSEPGRVEEEEKGTGRKIGKSTARMSTGVNPLEPKDDDSPTLPPGDQGG
ncbi:MAG: hypothetical protein QOG21_2309 [Actinomycetota bacterium]|jgi:hypothetical protein|nr:hypothetical protein [Actinomycetota bacterium]